MSENDSFQVFIDARSPSMPTIVGAFTGTWGLWTQLRFVWYELHTTELFAWAKLIDADNYREAAINVEIYYERAGASRRAKRLRNTKYILDHY